MISNVKKSKCFVIGNRTKLFRFDYAHQLVVRDIALEYVTNFITYKNKEIY